MGLVHSPQSPLSFPISRGKEISAAFLMCFLPEAFESPKVYRVSFPWLGMIYTLWEPKTSWSHNVLALIEATMMDVAPLAMHIHYTREKKSLISTPGLLGI